MNLDDLKPTWQHYKLQNSLEPFETAKVLEALAAEEPLALTHRIARLAMNLAMFLILFICCNGG